MRIESSLFAVAALATLVGASGPASAQNLTEGRQTVTRSGIIEQCRNEQDPSGGMQDHHMRPAVDACVQRIIRGQ